MKKVEITATTTTKHEFSQEDINDIMSTALEGGITYWCGRAIAKFTEDKKTFVGVAPEDQEKANKQWISDLIGLGGTIILVDVEDPKERWELDLDKMIKGIQQYCTEQNKNPEDLMDDYDAGDADSIVQYALFNEIVFG
jgi:hypothetical protein